MQNITVVRYLLDLYELT